MNHPQDNSPKIGVGIIVMHKGNVLLGKRKVAHGASTWSFPGGHLELGETTLECAKRELLEETGLIATTVAKSGLWTDDIFSANKHYVTLFALVENFSGTLQNKEPDKCEGWEWFSPDSFPEPLFLPIQNVLNELDHLLE